MYCEVSSIIITITARFTETRNIFFNVNVNKVKCTQLNDTCIRCFFTEIRCFFNAPNRNLLPSLVRGLLQNKLHAVLVSTTTNNNTTSYFRRLKIYKSTSKNLKSINSVLVAQNSNKAWSSVENYDFFKLFEK